MAETIPLQKPPKAKKQEKRRKASEAPTCRAEDSSKHRHKTAGETRSNMDATQPREEFPDHGMENSVGKSPAKTVTLL